MGKKENKTKIIKRYFENKGNQINYVLEEESSLKKLNKICSQK